MSAGRDSASDLKRDRGGGVNPESQLLPNETYSAPSARRDPDEVPHLRKDGDDEDEDEEDEIDEDYQDEDESGEVDEVKDEGGSQKKREDVTAYWPKDIQKKGSRVADYTDCSCSGLASSIETEWYKQFRKAVVQDESQVTSPMHVMGTYSSYGNKNKRSTRLTLADGNQMVWCKGLSVVQRAKDGRLGSVITCIEMKPFFVTYKIAYKEEKEPDGLVQLKADLTMDIAEKVIGEIEQRVNLDKLRSLVEAAQNLLQLGKAPIMYERGVLVRLARLSLDNILLEAPVKRSNLGKPRYLITDTKTGLPPLRIIDEEKVDTGYIFGRKRVNPDIDTGYTTFGQKGDNLDSGIVIQLDSRKTALQLGKLVRKQIQASGRREGGDIMVLCNKNQKHFDGIYITWLPWKDRPGKMKGNENAAGFWRYNVFPVQITANADNRHSIYPRSMACWLIHFSWGLIGKKAAQGITSRTFRKFRDERLEEGLSTTLDIVSWDALTSPLPVNVRLVYSALGHDVFLVASLNTRTLSDNNIKITRTSASTTPIPRTISRNIAASYVSMPFAQMYYYYVRLCIMVNDAAAAVRTLVDLKRRNECSLLLKS